MLEFWEIGSKVAWLQRRRVGGGGNVHIAICEKSLTRLALGFASSSPLWHGRHACGPGYAYCSGLLDRSCCPVRLF